MTKVLFWIAVVAVAYFAWMFSKRCKSVSKAEKTSQQKDPNAPTAMIECAQCGTHFPEDEAVLGDGVRYCSERCRTKARRKTC